MKFFFKLDLEFLYKISQENLLLVSMSAENNEIYKFSGMASDLLKELFEAEKFTFEQALTILKEKNILEKKDLEELWAFCVSEKIFTQAT